MTALLVSFQVLPFVVGGAVLARLVAESSASESEARPRIRSTQSTWNHLS